MLRVASLIGICVLTGQMPTFAGLTPSSVGAAVVTPHDQRDASIQVTFHFRGTFPHHWIVVDAVSGAVVVDQWLAPGETVQAVLRTGAGGSYGRIAYRNEGRSEWTGRAFIRAGDVVDIW